LKFTAEIKSYQIVNRVEGKIAKIVLEVPQSKIEDSFFIGGLVQNCADFSVDNVLEPPSQINE